MSKLQTVEAFLNAYFSQDKSRALALITDDFLWQNMAMPKSRIEGKAMVKAILDLPHMGLPLPLEDAHHDTLRYAESNDILHHERIDHLKFRGAWIDIPCAAVFRVTDGKVALWRDYFDIGGYVRFMEKLGVKLDTSQWW